MPLTMNQRWTKTSNSDENPIKTLSSSREFQVSFKRCKGTSAPQTSVRLDMHARVRWSQFCASANLVPESHHRPCHNAYMIDHYCSAFVRRENKNHSCVRRHSSSSLNKWLFHHFSVGQNVNSAFVDSSMGYPLWNFAIMGRLGRSWLPTWISNNEHRIIRSVHDDALFYSFLHRLQQVIVKNYMLKSKVTEIRRQLE